MYRNYGQSSLWEPLISGYSESSMKNQVIYSSVGMLPTLLFAFLLFAVVGFLFLDLVRTAFTKIDFSWGQALFVLFASLLECSAPMVRKRLCSGLRHSLPSVSGGCRELQHTAGSQYRRSDDTIADLHGADPQVPGISELRPYRRCFYGSLTQPCSQASEWSGNCHSRPSSISQYGNSRDSAGLCQEEPP